MTKDEWKDAKSRFVKALVDFVERATKSGATPRRGRGSSGSCGDVAAGF